MSHCHTLRRIQFSKRSYYSGMHLYNMYNTRRPSCSYITRHFRVKVVNVQLNNDVNVDPLRAILYLFAFKMARLLSYV